MNNIYFHTQLKRIFRFANVYKWLKRNGYENTHYGVMGRKRYITKKGIMYILKVRRLKKDGKIYFETLPEIFENANAIFHEDCDLDLLQSIIGNTKVFHFCNGPMPEQVKKRQRKHKFYETLKFLSNKKKVEAIYQLENKLGIFDNAQRQLYIAAIIYKETGEDSLYKLLSKDPNLFKRYSTVEDPDIAAARAYLTPTEIADKIGSTAVVVNQTLLSLEYQMEAKNDKLDLKYVPFKNGIHHGVACFYVNKENLKFGYSLLWSKDILPLLEKNIKK